YPMTSEDDRTTITQLTDRNKNHVELSVFHPQDHEDTWMYVQSEAKRKKEASMTEKLSQRFEEEMESIKGALSKKSGTKKVERVWERIGRAKEKYNRASARYEVSVDQVEGIATDIRWKRKPSPAKEEKEKGVYFLRTS